MFKLVNEETGSVVGGTVRLQENDKARQFRGFNANEKVYVPAPSNRTGKWLVVCHVLGYRHLKKVVGYENAAEVEGASLGPDSEVIIPLGLERVRRGKARTDVCKKYESLHGTTGNRLSITLI